MATDYLNSKEAAAFLGISTPTLWRWEANIDDFPKATRVGRVTRYKRSDLEEFMKSNSEREA